MSKRNQVQFSRPEDPKFLRLIKEQIGYKNEPSVDTKRQKLDQNFDDSSDSDDEQPQIVVTKTGDLTAEQVEAERRRIESENLTKPADLSQRIIFKAKTVKSEASSEEKVTTEPTSKKKNSSKKSVTVSKLSFDLEDEKSNSELSTKLETISKFIYDEIDNNRLTPRRPFICITQYSQEKLSASLTYKTFLGPPFEELQRIR